MTHHQSDPKGSNDGVNRLRYYRRLDRRVDSLRFTLLVCRCYQILCGIHCKFGGHVSCIIHDVAKVYTT